MFSKEKHIQMVNINHPKKHPTAIGCFCIISFSENNTNFASIHTFVRLQSQYAKAYPYIQSG